MAQPEDFRDDVYLGDNNRLETLRTESARADAPRPQTDREPLGRSFTRDLAREFSREPFREVTGREPLASPLPMAAGREPLPREGSGRLTGSRLPGTPLPGSPLSGHSGGSANGTQDSAPHKQAPPPGRALSTTTLNAAPIAGGDDPTAMQRAMTILKQAAPFVARLLPLLEGNITATVGNLLTPRPHAPAAPVSVDLTPVHSQISELQVQHTELRTVVQEQTTGLKRVEDQLEMVREATDRNTLEQQELIEDLKSMGNRMNLIAVLLSILLVVSVLVNAALYLHIKKVFPNF